MKLKTFKFAAFVIGVVLLTVTGVVLWSASGALHQAKLDFQTDHEISFVVRPYSPVLGIGFEPISSPALFTQAARFQNHLYIAGPAGLLAYAPSGQISQRFTVGNELPRSPLIALATGVLADSKDTELILATAADGLLAYNGHTFRQILPEGADARSITAILVTASGHLLIGTKKRGVLIYDGKQISPLHVTLSDCYVTALAGNESNLWVGTLNHGVLHFTGGETETFGEAQGLPDPQVTSISLFQDNTYIGTPLGVAVFNAGRFSRVLAAGVFTTALLATADQLYIGSEDQGVFSLTLEGQRPNSGLNSGDDLAEVHQLFTLDGSIFAVARNGLYRRNPHGLAWQQILPPEAAVLSDHNISALSDDSTGRLWIGYFDHGLDILAADNSRVTHIEDDHLFCINRIFRDARTAGIDVATANGFVRFDNSGNEQQTLTHFEGLIADDVTDVADYGDGLALATPAGLTFLDATGARSMYAFQGLVNNHVYALGVIGDQLMAGTLGGLSLLEKGNVAINYTTSNSNLKHNWITAIVPLGSEWMVGTYGAGILGLDASGHFHTYDIGSGNFEVNPNAMLVTSKFVLAGTLGNGLYLYDRTSQRWSVIEHGLPSLNVTALTAANGYIYIGTDNGLVRIPEQMLHS